MTRILMVIVCLILGLSSIQSCFCTDEQTAAPAAKAPVPLSGMSDLSNRAGQIVRIEGTFQGWDASGCRFAEGAAAQGRTRGDWLIRSGLECFYVTGGFPPGLDALNPEHIGIPILLEANAVRDENGKLYLEYRSSRRTN